MFKNKKSLFIIFILSGLLFLASNEKFKNSLLLVASGHGHKLFIQGLLFLKADINCSDSHGITPIFFAAMENRISTIKFLLDHGADPFIQNKSSEVLLGYLARERNSPLIQEILEKLVSSNHDVNISDMYGRSPRLLSIFYGTHQLTEKLILKGADPNLRSGTGLTPLVASILFHKKEDFETLLQHGADLEFQDNAHQQTALMHAVLINDTYFVERLLKVGARTNIRDEHGLTAYDFAIHVKNQEIINLFLNSQRQFSHKPVH
jgi:ankyrin repeat protein